MKRRFVYVLWDADGEALYVGSTKNIRQRTAKHRQTKDWWPQVADITFEEVVGNRESFARERQVTAELQPTHCAYIPDPRRLALDAADADRSAA